MVAVLCMTNSRETSFFLNLSHLQSPLSSQCTALCTAQCFENAMGIVEMPLFFRTPVLTLNFDERTIVGRCG